jgi:hypothetical protein
VSSRQRQRRIQRRTARFELDKDVDLVDGQRGIEAVVADVQHLRCDVSCGVGCATVRVGWLHWRLERL